jgi:hypothetical protein
VPPHWCRFSPAQEDLLVKGKGKGKGGATASQISE